MSLESMSFILGGILVAAALFGGGLEIKELKLPQIGRVARVFAAAFGLGFVLLAIYLNQLRNVSDAKPKASDAQREAMTFQSPMLGDARLDACQLWAQNCGEPAATAWCRAKGFSRATEFPTENVGAAGTPTRLIGVDLMCREKFCASFVYIKCEK